MICEHFTHIGVGDTGEGIIRTAIQVNLITPHRIAFADSRAHLTLGQARKILESPSFSFVRNPFDFYTSFWIHELKLHRWMGTFSDWFYHRGTEYGSPTGGNGVSMQAWWDYFTAPGVDHIGKFEALEEDFATIMSALVPFLTAEEVKSWFPHAYKQWANRPWIEGIEQWMRQELYTQQMKDDVLRQDAWFFSEFGYTFEETYDFSETYRRLSSA